MSSSTQRLPEFIASTLPLPQQWVGQSIWRPDLGYAQRSDGLQWSPLAGLTAAQAVAVGRMSKTGYRTVLVGDSMTDNYETVASGVSAAYDAATGILTVTVATTHQQAVGWYLTIWNRAFTASNKLFRVPVLTTPSTAIFTVSIGAGLAISASDANWRYRPENWRASQHFMPWLQSACGHLFNVVYNGGASGDRADEVLARLDVDCLDYAPDVVICQMPGINDLSAAYPTRSFEQIVADRHAIVDRITAAGIKLIVLTTTGVSTGHAQATVNSGGKVIEMNRRLVTYCRDKANVILFDAWRTMADPLSTTGNAAAVNTRTSDLIHYSMVGGRAVGEALWAHISKAFPPVVSALPCSVLDAFVASALTLSSVTVTGGVCSATASASGLRVGERFKISGGTPAFNEYVTLATVVGTAITFTTSHAAGTVTGTVRLGNNVQLIDTPLLTTATGGTVAGGVTGVAASGVKVTITGGTPTVAASVVARADGLGNNQVAVITSAGSTSEVVIEADFNWAVNGGSVNWPAQILAGRTYVFEGLLTLTGVAGSNVDEIRPNIVCDVAGVAYLVYSQQGYTSGSGLNSDLVDYHFRTAPMKLPAGGGTTYFKWGVSLGFSAAGTALTVSLGRIRLYELES